MISKILTASDTSPLWTIGGPALGAAIAGLIGFAAAWFNARQQRTTNLNERFATASRLLGDEQPAVRLAGVHAMAGLADDWEEQRQTCINVLCAYLRMPYAPAPAHDVAGHQHIAWLASKEVRHTVITVIREHLLPGARRSWAGQDFDLTRAVFDGGSFQGVHFTGGTVSFLGARFSSGLVDFTDANFSGGEVTFWGARFEGAMVAFDRARFTGSHVIFDDSTFTADLVTFPHSEITDGHVSFARARLEDDDASVGFFGARFAGGSLSFEEAHINRGHLDFAFAEFCGAHVSFRSAIFAGGEVSFGRAKFTGSEVSFRNAHFTGARVDLAKPKAWDVPPQFDDEVLASHPAGLRLPQRPP